MRIAHVNVARNYRGGERQTELLIRELLARGIEQRLVARRGSPLEHRVAALGGVEVRGVSGHLPGVVSATGRADLVHVHEGRSVYAAYMRNLISGTPYIATRRVNNPIGDHRMAHRAYRRAACVAAVAPEVADVVRGFDSAVRVCTIYSASSSLSADPAEVAAIRTRIGGNFIVGHVGALDNSQKAQEIIIAAARRLATSHPGIRFVLVGGGSDEAMLRELAAGLTNLTFTGFVDNVGDYLGAFDSFVLPSRREGVGSILFDAMEHALPIIATPVGGVRNIVHENENGLFIEIDNAEQLSEKILLLAADPALRERLGANGKRIAVAHTAPVMADAYVELYRNVLARRTDA
jgi:glycosyltransferase involved in cell wall biosynthesis